MNEYFVYILTNHSRMLYVGVTNNLKRRVYEHRSKIIPDYASRYNITQLVYFESTPNVTAAIAREKQIKGWLRWRKIELITSKNPRWIDLSAEWSDSLAA